MEIANRRISVLDPPYILADISGNHNQVFQTAINLIKAAKDSGCDAVKFQTYKPEHLTMPNLGFYKGRELWELYSSICMPYDWYPELFAYSKSINLTAFTTVFNPADVEWLEKLGCPAYKVGSYDINYLELLDAVRDTGKPVMISTGCAMYSDLAFISIRFSALNTILLKCVSSYPAKPEMFNLKTIPDMKREFGFDVGLSDHSIGSAVGIASIALGAVAIEKHITLSKDTIDGEFAFLPYEFKQFVEDCNIAWKALGTIDYGTPAKDKQYMRSLYAKRDIAKGERFTKDNVALVRPNTGMSIKALNNFIDKRASMDIYKATALHLRHIK